MFDKSMFNAITGWFNEEEGKWLYNWTLGSSRVLEIGAWQGRTTYALLSALRDSPGDYIDRVVVSIDPYLYFKCPPYYGELKSPEGRAEIIGKFQKVVALFDGKVRHRHIELLAEEAYPQLLAEFPSFDRAFIDGDHSYPKVKIDIENCLKLVRPGGWVGGHDYYDNGGNYEVKTAVDELIPKNALLRGAGGCWAYQLPVAV